MSEAARDRFSSDASEEGLDALVTALRGRRLCVLGGAGVSTDSGIPDYRGPQTRHRVRTPIQHADFVARESTRRRYWARSLVGYPRIRDAEPNASHRALVELEQAGLTTGLITQNVDALHARAGSSALVELHGSLARVRCLGCAAVFERRDFQDELHAANPWFAARGEISADGDAELDARAEQDFVVPGCAACGGTLMPDVVFFGGNVPRERVERGMAWLDASDALLVVGSSLTVYSGYRFARHAHAHGKPVHLLTLGETRADALATRKLEAPLGSVLPALVRALLGARAAPIPDVSGPRDPGSP